MPVKSPYAIAYPLLILAAVVVLLNFPWWTVDDAYIAFRYAENLALHGELTYNVGEDPVEGYTGLLMPLLIAGAILLGISPITASHTIGITALGVCLLALHGLLARLRVSTVQIIATMILFVSAGFLYTNALSGLETLPFTALLLLATLQLHRLLESDTVAFWPHALLALCLLLLALCRPEGAVYAMVVGGLICGLSLFRQGNTTPLLAQVLVLGIPAVVYFIGRWWWYGYPLPNTFYAKLASGFSRGTWWDVQWFGYQYLLLPLAGVVLGWVMAWSRADSRPYLRRANLLTLGAALLFTGVVMGQYFRSTLFMNFSFRFFLPFYPLALVVCNYLLAPVVSGLLNGDGKQRRRIALGGLGLVLAVQLGLQLYWVVSQEIPYTSRYRTLITEMYYPLADFIHQHVPEDEWLVVHIDAGTVPYRTRLKTIDFGALNDEYLAHNQHAPQAERVDYFYARNPGALVFTSYDWEALDHNGAEQALVNDPRFQNYRLVRKFGHSTDQRYYQFLYLRGDLVSPEILDPEV